MHLRDRARFFIFYLTNAAAGSQKIFLLTAIPQKYLKKKLKKQH